MTGLIVLYTANGLRLRSAIFSSAENRKLIVNMWQESKDWTFEQWESFYFQIEPKEEVEVINIKGAYTNIHKRVDFNPVSVPLKPIEIDDFIPVGYGKRETFFHKCYYKSCKS